jgi:nitrite reductase/ring-hydroxylating ferredoxin subunit
MFHAFGDTCTRLRCSLAEGKLDGAVVTCACHGSQFDVTTAEARLDRAPISRRP